MLPSIFRPSEESLRVDLLLLPELSLLSFASTLEPLRAANRVAGRRLYDWRLLGAGSREIVTSSGVHLAADALFDPGDVGDLLIVLAAFNVQRHAGPALLGQLRRLGRRGVPMGGVEAGAWVLAMAGLLAGRRATTHWEDLESFAARFPETDVRPDRYVIDGPVFTTGGASPALDTMLALIRARQGYALALDVASIFIYDQSHAGEDPQPSLSLGRLGWYEPRVARAMRAMEETIGEPLPLAAIAARAGTSRRTLETLFAGIVGVPPRDFYLGARLNAGRRLVVETRQSMTAIAERVGFASASAFARAFRRRFGLSPTQARRDARQAAGASAGR